MAQGRLGIAFRDWLNARDVRRMTRRKSVSSSPKATARVAPNFRSL